MGIYKQHVIASGETLQSIAFKELGDISKWRVLVTINDLEYPYIVQADEDRLANPEHLRAVGDTINLPATKSLSTTSIDMLNSYSVNRTYDMALGMDIQLGVQTNTMLAESQGELKANKGDLSVVTGTDNLKQSLILRLQTRRGTLLRHPNYGSYLNDYLGEQISTKSLANTMVEVERTITTDDRVKSVTTTKGTIDGNQIVITAMVIPIGQEAAFKIFVSRAQSGTINIY